MRIPPLNRTKKTEAAPGKPTIVLEGTDIEVLDGKATINVHCELKLSRDYKSGSSSIGMQFVTHADRAEHAAKAAFAKVKALVESEMGKISKAIDAMESL